VSVLPLLTGARAAAPGSRLRAAGLPGRRGNARRSAAVSTLSSYAGSSLLSSLHKPAASSSAGRGTHNRRSEACDRNVRLWKPTTGRV